MIYWSPISHVTDFLVLHSNLDCRALKDKAPAPKVMQNVQIIGMLRVSIMWFMYESVYVWHLGCPLWLRPRQSAWPFTSFWMHDFRRIASQALWCLISTLLLESIWKSQTCHEQFIFGQSRKPFLWDPPLMFSISRVLIWLCTVLCWWHCSVAQISALQEIKCSFTSATHIALVRYHSMERLEPQFHIEYIWG